MSHDELLVLANCVNEVLHNSSVDERDCGTRIGVGHESLKALHRELSAQLERVGDGSTEVFDAWRAGNSIQIRAISAFGDPADLSFDEVREKILPILDEGLNA